MFVIEHDLIEKYRSNQSQKCIDDQKLQEKLPFLYTLPLHYGKLSQAP